MVTSQTESPASEWQWLYQVSGTAAALTAVIIPIQIAAYVIYPPPTTTRGFFLLFQENALLGLVALDLLLIIDIVLLALILLALFVALRRVNPSVIAIGTTLGFVAIAVYFPSNPAVEMLNLSREYATASSDAQRQIYLAAGEALLATFEGTAFHVYYILGSISILLVSAVMLQSERFSNVTAYAGILGNMVALGFYVPRIGLILSVVSVVMLWVWYVLVARTLFQPG